MRCSALYYNSTATLGEQVTLSRYVSPRTPKPIYNSQFLYIIHTKLDRKNAADSTVLSVLHHAVLGWTVPYYAALLGG